MQKIRQINLIIEGMSCTTLYSEKAHKSLMNKLIKECTHFSATGLHMETAFATWYQVALMDILESVLIVAIWGNFYR